MRHCSKIFLLCLAILTGACTHQPLSWSRTGNALEHAATHPSVWAPLVGASIFAIDDLDDRTTKQLAEKTPLFGSNSSAGSTSSDIKQLLFVTSIVSALTVPVPDDDNAIAHRGDHLAIMYAGMELTTFATQKIKKSVDRERPDKSNNSSFPSGHASQAFFFATSASNNFHQRWGDSTTAKWADAGLYTAASLTAWARVEANAHHPADVLVGASLGNFIGLFMNDLFLKENSNTSLSAYFDGTDFSIGIAHQF